MYVNLYLLIKLNIKVRMEVRICMQNKEVYIYILKNTYRNKIDTSSLDFTYERSEFHETSLSLKGH